MKTMAKGQLQDLIASHFPKHEKEVPELLKRLVYRAEGIFLWLALVVASLKRGAREGDTFEELENKIESLPATLEKLYERMMGTMKKEHQKEAMAYFRLMLVSEEMTGRELSLLTLACVSKATSSELLSLDYSTDKKQYSTALEHCNRLALRVQTRWAGLVDVFGPSADAWKPLSIQLIDCGTRRLNFTHRTIRDFLVDEQGVLSHNEWVSDLFCDFARGTLGSMLLLLHRVALVEGHHDSVNMYRVREYFGQMFAISSRLEKPSSSQTSASAENVAQWIHESWSLLDKISLSPNGPSAVQKLYHQFSQGFLGHINHFTTVAATTIAHMQFITSDLEFAAFFGCSKFVQGHVAQGSLNSEELNGLLVCAMLGLQESSWFHRYWPPALRWFDATESPRTDMIQDLLEHGADLNLMLYLNSTNAMGEMDSKKVPLLSCLSFYHLNPSNVDDDSVPFLDMVNLSLDYGVDPNCSTRVILSVYRVTNGLAHWGLIEVEISILCFVQDLLALCEVGGVDVFSMEVAVEILESLGARPWRRCHWILPSSMSPMEGSPWAFGHGFHVSEAESDRFFEDCSDITHLTIRSKAAELLLDRLQGSPMFDHIFPFYSRDIESSLEVLSEAATLSDIPPTLAEARPWVGR